MVRNDEIIELSYHSGSAFGTWLSVISVNRCTSPVMSSLLLIQNSSHCFAVNCGY